MLSSDLSDKTQATQNPKHLQWLAPLLGIGVEAACAALGHTQLETSLPYVLLIGATFALCFWWGFGERADSPGAGLIWGLGFASLVWLLIPAGLLPLLRGTPRSAAMLMDARARFPELVAYLVLLGMPVGLALGILGAIRLRSARPKFRWGRAIVVGGVAGTLSGLVFSRWMYEGGFYPLLGGFQQLGSHAEMVAAHFLVALAEVRHKAAELGDFDCRDRRKSSLYNRNVQKDDVVQTYPLEAICGG